MNWLDIAIIITSALGALFGLRTGIIRTGFAAAAVIFGMVILGEVTRYAGAWFGDYVEDEAVIKVIGYVMTFVLSVSIAAVSVMVARQCVYTLFLGWTDRLAGLALGLAVAVGFSTAAIVAMTYRANDQVVAAEGQEAAVWESTWQEHGFKEELANALGESSLVPAFSAVIDSVPGKLHILPSTFRLAVGNLKEVPENTSAVVIR